MAINDDTDSSGQALKSPYPDAKSRMSQGKGEMDQSEELCPAVESEKVETTKETTDLEGTNKDSKAPPTIEGNVKETIDLEGNAGSSSTTSNPSEEKDEELLLDRNIVDWDGPDDPTNPMNWRPWKVKAHIFIVSAITFIRYT